MGKIVNLHEAERYLPEDDLSHYLPYSDIAFANRSFEVKNEDGVSNFGAMFSIKEYSELSTRLIDNFLHLPQEFLITQTFDYSLEENNIKATEYQNKILQISQDESFAESSGLKKIVEKTGILEKLLKPLIALV